MYFGLMWMCVERTDALNSRQKPSTVFVGCVASWRQS